MKTKAPARGSVLGFLGLVALSSLIMLWLFWHFPRGTGAFTFVVLASFGLSARLAQWLEAEGLGPEAHPMLSDSDSGRQA